MNRTNTMQEKDRKMFYSMGEVAEMLDVNASTLRHWENRFDILKPKKNKKGNRMFTRTDVENLKVIYHLVKEKGVTIDGAIRMIRDQRENVVRDMEVIERLMVIRSMLQEIRQELGEERGVAIKFRNEEEAPPVEEKFAAKAEALPKMYDVTSEAARADMFRNDALERSLENIMETPEVEPEYVELLSEELHQEAATAAEVREVLAELDRAEPDREETPAPPPAIEQTLF